MRFYSIKLGASLYLTSDGTVGGIPVKLAVIGWEHLINPIAGNSVRANTGKPIRQTILRPAGDVVEIQIETWLPKSLWDAIKAVIDGCNTTDSQTTITATGDTGNFTRNVKPVLDQPYSAERFRNERIIKPVFRFETV